MTSAAAVSIWSVVVVELTSRVVAVWVAWCMSSDVVSLVDIGLLSFVGWVG